VSGGRPRPGLIGRLDETREPDRPERVSQVPRAAVEAEAAQDRELVQAALGGDPKAFASLVARYQRLVASVAWRYGVRREEIEDVVSEVFLKVYRNLGRYRPDHPFSTWLYRLAANHVVDHGRRRRKEAGRTEMPRQLIDSSPMPDERSELRERAELVHAALGELPVRYREVLFLVYLEGMLVAEAASQLGLPQGTVKSRLKRGREALRRILVRRSPQEFGGNHALP
jgi:RNA polymerase sigma-70 factor (ECF subfamily)